MGIRIDENNIAHIDIGVNFSSGLGAIINIGLPVDMKDSGRIFWPAVITIAEPPEFKESVNCRFAYESKGGVVYREVTSE